MIKNNKNHPDWWICSAEYGIRPVAEVKPGQYNAVALAFAHGQFATIGDEAIRALGKLRHVLYDLKHLLTTA